MSTNTVQPFKQINQIHQKHQPDNSLYSKPPHNHIRHPPPQRLGYLNICWQSKMGILYCCAPGLLTSNAPHSQLSLCPIFSSTKSLFTDLSLGRFTRVTSPPFLRKTQFRVSKNYVHTPWVSHFRSCSISSGGRKRCES